MKLHLKLTIIAFTLLTIVGCGGGSSDTESVESGQTNTCATCGASFDWSCTTDVFGGCVCSEECSGR
jgi:hypothetical protein